jgi:hypothetical protein
VVQLAGLPFVPATAISRSPAWAVGIFILTPPPKFPLADALAVKVTPEDGVTPVPLSVTLCGLPAALSLMLTLALRGPVALGVNVTLIVQVALTASVFGLIGQVFVSAKSVGFVPASAMLEIVRAAVPLLVSVTLCAALVVLTL